MKSDEDEAFASLWNAVVDGIEQLSSHTILAGLSQVLENLFLDAHLGHPLNVLHDKSSWLDLSDYTHELPVERISWVIYQSRVVSNLGESLARGAANDDIRALARLDHCAANLMLPNVSYESRGPRKVPSKRSHGVGIVVSAG
jgi:hypothetical protein